MNTLLTIIAILVDIGIAIASNNHMAKNTTINNTYYVSTDLPLSVKGVNIAYFSFLIILIVSLYSELPRLIEVGASCFNHYCIGYDDTQHNVLQNVHRRIS